MSITTAGLDLLLLGLDIDAVDARGVEAQDFRLGLHRQHRAGFLGDIGRDFERHELVDQPFRRPDAVVAAVQDLVGAYPEQQFGDDVGEVAGAAVDEGQRYRKAGIDVGFLGCDPAEIVQPRQPAVLDNEIQVLERGRDIVDIGDVERIAIERDDGRTLVDMDVLDAEFLRGFEILVRRLVGELVALGFATPFGGVELDTLQLVLLRQGMQVFQTLGAVARIESAVQDEAIRMALLHRRIALGGVETVLVEVRQVCGLQDRHVVITGDEQILEHGLGIVLFELLLRPELRWGTEVRMIGIETLDELLAMDVLLVGRTSIPEMRMPIDDEDLFTLCRPVHGVLPVPHPG